jgi:hypothetical protein
MDPKQKTVVPLLNDDEIVSADSIEQVTKSPDAAAPPTATEPITESTEATIQVNNSDAISPPKSSSFKPGEVFNATTKGLKGISTKLNPVKKQLDKGFNQVRQVSLLKKKM